MRKKFTPALLIIIGMAVSVPLFAHHGNAAYDNAKQITVSGIVTEWIWANPHCWLKFDAKDDKGEVQHWLVEASNPPDMSRLGWAKDAFKVGDEVTVTLIQAKNGQHIGRFKGDRSVVLSNGHVYSAVDPNAVPTAPVTKVQP